ncbi:MAG TPA: tetratricopeptide repeat protein [Candidatus Acidoferrales bacterium]
MKRRTASCVVLMLALGSSARLQSQETRPNESVSASFPDKNWEVKIDSPGFAVESAGPKSDGREYLLASNSKTGIILSVTLEESKDGADSKTCPEFLRKRVDGLSQLDVKDVKSSEINSMAVIEYLLPKLQGIPVRQKNVVLCTTNQNVYIDVHLSKAQFQPSDEPLLLEVLAHLHISERSTSAESEPRGGAAARTSSDYFMEGGRYYVANDFKNAIGPYEKALSLEKQQRRLSRDYWRVLVDNLGMAYGITGELNRSEEAFDYGISQDPDYPMFYYNLGCVAAERNDMDKAMAYLSKAFSLKANSIPGEKMPDPRRDDSFQRFMSNAQFRKLADSLESPSN